MPAESSNCPAPTVLVPFLIAAAKSSTDMPRAHMADGLALIRIADFAPNTPTLLTPGRMLMRWPTWVLA